LKLGKSRYKSRRGVSRKKPKTLSGIETMVL